MYSHVHVRQRLVGDSPSTLPPFPPRSLITISIYHRHTIESIAASLGSKRFLLPFLPSFPFVPRVPRSHRLSADSLVLTPWCASCRRVPRFLCTACYFIDPSVRLLPLSRSVVTHPTWQQKKRATCTFFPCKHFEFDYIPVAFFSWSWITLKSLWDQHFQSKDP